MTVVHCPNCGAGNLEALGDDRFVCHQIECGVRFDCTATVEDAPLSESESLSKIAASCGAGAGESCCALDGMRAAGWQPVLFLDDNGATIKITKPSPV